MGWFDCALYQVGPLFCTIVSKQLLDGHVTSFFYRMKTKFRTKEQLSHLMVYNIL